MIEKPVTFNSLTFNNEAHSDLTTSPHHWIKLDSVDGLYDDEIRYESHVLPGVDGERSADVLLGGKQLVLTGTIYGWNLHYLRVGQRALQAAFYSRAQYKLYYYDWSDGGTGAFQLYFTVRKNQPLVMTDEITELGHYKVKWTIGLRADDPKSRKTSDNSVYPSFQGS
jgi:hypothetical protein